MSCRCNGLVNGPSVNWLVQNSELAGSQVNARIQNLVPVFKNLIAFSKTSSGFPKLNPESKNQIWFLKTWLGFQILD
jgi:hypothetical protein